MSWYVLYTKPRTEKRVAESLEQMGVEVYCPLITEIKQWKDRKKKLKTPLFKSYVFIKLEEKNRNRVFDVPGVVRYLFWLGKPAIVRNEEIEVIQEWLDGEKVDDAKVDHLNQGDKISIKNGVFKDHEAIIREVGNRKMRLILPKLGCTVEVLTKEVI
ncbi:UpxY family transcription antiterminator [Salegentibacter mishustinae]|jgi:transcription antitermination factor NusG|uniref:Antitermination protein NusG n=1 Tax=Salegentibacter mishustinae TaxID=270918 RepID=A0A0Q9Z8J2_9FLAO|nr:UpxY family transcription antiterminator [Salegentibacter mishustinae]KRG29279.1 antitermination protein NusG [Salegentibacter mishustinae]PNW21673.1 antitermination protein NusG [Salegentibacter mishustinae]PZX65012.1 transcription antitermination factor NusG [Salegentibacter mishustinae]GGW87873.1 transcriptional antiterminator [Salegentibacter mishustinae]|tara:strand:+ start:830 stop:1303 length:474 start_codon:yes stop_codon:yes gene_type:complete